MSGNLYQDPESFPGWGGCEHQDCLPQCSMGEGHCERLRLHMRAMNPKAAALADKVDAAIESGQLIYMSQPAPKSK